MKQKYDDAEIGLRSLNRATARLYEKARKNNAPLPIWVDGKVEYMLPEQAQIDELLKKATNGL